MFFHIGWWSRGPSRLRSRSRTDVRVDAMLRVPGDPAIALVHDYLLVLRGAERTFAAMTDVWPEAPIFTLLYDEAGTRGPVRRAAR